MTKKSIWGLIGDSIFPAMSVSSPLIEALTYDHKGNNELIILVHRYLFATSNYRK